MLLLCSLFGQQRDQATRHVQFSRTSHNIHVDFHVDFLLLWHNIMLCWWCFVEHVTVVINKHTAVAAAASVAVPAVKPCGTCLSARRLVMLSKTQLHFFVTATAAATRSSVMFCLGECLARRFCTTSFFFLASVVRVHVGDQSRLHR